MAELKFKPVRHTHKAFLARAATRKGFIEAYDALALEYQVADQMLKAGFAHAVKDYLVDCRREGVHPEQPASGK